MPRWQVAQMMLGGLVSHLTAEALWALMHINEIGCCHIPILPMFDGSCVSHVAFYANNFFVTFPFLPGIVLINFAKNDHQKWMTRCMKSSAF